MAGKGWLKGLPQERQFKLHLPIYPVEFTFLQLQSDELKAQALLQKTLRTKISHKKKKKYYPENPLYPLPNVERIHCRIKSLGIETADPKDVYSFQMPRDF